MNEVRTNLVSLRMPVLKSAYKSPFWLRHPHLATIVPSMYRKVEGVQYERERIDTPDGDFLDLDWLKHGSRKLVILSHGLEGSSGR
jgi:predicted alpha/beta-fold hydrolase